MGTTAIIAIGLSGLATVLVVGGFAWTAKTDRSARRREPASRHRAPPAGAGSVPEAPVPPAAGEESARSARDDGDDVGDDS